MQWVQSFLIHHADLGFACKTFLAAGRQSVLPSLFVGEGSSARGSD